MIAVRRQPFLQQTFSPGLSEVTHEKFTLLFFGLELHSVLTCTTAPIFRLPFPIPEMELGFRPNMTGFLLEVLKSGVVSVPKLKPSSHSSEEPRNNHQDPCPRSRICRMWGDDRHCCLAVSLGPKTNLKGAGNSKWPLVGDILAPARSTTDNTNPAWEPEVSQLGNL